MSSTSLWLRSVMRRLQDADLEAKLRALKRHPRKRLFLLLIAAVLFFLYLYSSSRSASSASIAQQCVKEKMKFWASKIENGVVGSEKTAVRWIGNGYFGVDSTGELRLSTNGSRVLDFNTGFYPYVAYSIDGTSDSAESVLTDFETGDVKVIKCFLLDSECACTVRTSYAHRSRRNVIIEELQIINPTRASLTVNIDRPAHSDWKAERTGSDVFVHTRNFRLQSQQLLLAGIICSSAPGKITVTQKREESLRFTCIIQTREVASTVDTVPIFNNITSSVVSLFQIVKSDAKLIDQQHRAAWSKLNEASFYLSHSKADDVLNGNMINATRYILLSNTKALTLDLDVPEDTRKILDISSRKNELCYSEHSTLLYPSRLWQSWNNPSDLLKLAELWLLTLEKRGCAHVLKSGATGLAQAFLLSLSASSFHDSHLQMELDPADLHREMSVNGIEIGSAGIVANIKILIDEENRPYMELSSSSTLFACDGGCKDPITLGRTYVKMPIKVTKPITSILYIATNRRHLEQLSAAIHVSDIASAPAHHNDVIEQHRTGGSGGMPTSFWLFLGAILIAFHIFLAKLLWTEWRKGDMTPYNPYLRSRYSYQRSH